MYGAYRRPMDAIFTDVAGLCSVGDLDFLQETLIWYGQWAPCLWHLWHILLTYLWWLSLLRSPWKEKNIKCSYFFWNHSLTDGDGTASRLCGNMAGPYCTHSSCGAIQLENKWCNAELWSLVNLSTFRKGNFHLRMRRPLDLSCWNGYLQHLCSSKKLFFRNFVVHF